MERVHLVSLGCPKNRVDSEVMVGKLQQGAFELVEHAEDADVIVVNTCSFIKPATEESVDTILEMAQLKHTGKLKKLVVTGCMVQRFGKDLEIEMPEVDYFLGTGEYHRISEVLGQRENIVKSYIDTPLYIHDELAPRVNSWAPHSAYLKLSEGCDHRCAFCIIPQLRGKMRSRSVASLVAEARRLAMEGVVELNLVSQDSTAYGRDLVDGSDLGSLLRALAQVEGLQWIRLHYVYPVGVPAAALSAIADEPRILKYVDMPLQHASGRMLRAMKRGVSRDGQEKILRRIRQAIPDVTLRTTFIVGFPGETDDDFAELCDFVEVEQFDRVGVFTYFQEEGTPAALLPDQVDESSKIARQKHLMKLQAAVSKKKHKKLIGSEQMVLVDGPSKESPLVLVGRMGSQAPDVDGSVWLTETDESVRAGQFRKVRIVKATAHDLVGEVIG